MPLKWKLKAKKSVVFKDPKEEDDTPMSIGLPTGVTHNFHVGFNKVTGNFEGLPPSWTSLLQSSDIS